MNAALHFVSTGLEYLDSNRAKVVAVKNGCCFLRIRWAQRELISQWTFMELTLMNQRNPRV